MLRTFVTILVAGIQVVAISACQSKFSDKQPDSMGNSSGFTVESRLKANEDLDKKLARVEEISEKIRRLIGSFRKIQAPSAGQDIYTHVDFMLDVNEEFKQSSLESQDGKWIKYGELELNLEQLSPECRTISTKVETYSSVLDATQNLQAKGSLKDGLIYSIKTCDTKGEYVQIVTVEFTETKMSVNFNNENLRTVLKDTLFPAVQVATGCEIETDLNDILGRATCTNLTTKLSASEELHIDNLTYDNKNDMRFQLDAKIIENNKQKASLTFTIDKAGKVDLQASKS